MAILEQSAAEPFDLNKARSALADLEKTLNGLARRRPHNLKLIVSKDEAAFAACSMFSERIPLVLALANNASRNIAAQEIAKENKTTKEGGLHPEEPPKAEEGMSRAAQVNMLFRAAHLSMADLHTIRGILKVQDFRNRGEKDMPGHPQAD